LKEARAVPGPRGQTWYAVGRLTELTEAGAKGGVWQSFDDIEEAKLFADKHHLALFPGTFAERPAERSTIEVSREELDGLQEKGQGQELARQLRVLDWATEQGTYHEFGVWYDRGQKPRVGQLVHYTTGLDYRDEPEERRVTPSHPIEAGPPEKPQYVVIEKLQGRPLSGQIVAVFESQEEAREKVKGLDAKRLSLEPAARQEQWQRLEAGPELRELANRERQAEAVPASVPQEPAERGRDEPPRVATNEKELYRARVIEWNGDDGKPQRTVLLDKQVTEPDGRVRTDKTELELSDVREVLEALERKRDQMLEEARQQEEQRAPAREGLRITTHERGRHRAEVVERMGEDGKPQRTVLLSKQVTEPDGRVRTTGTVLDFDAIREIRRSLEQHRERAAERTRQQEPERAPRQEQERDQGLSMQL